MFYKDLLKKLANHEIGQVGREKWDEHEVVILARTEEVVFPFKFQMHRLYAEGDNWDVTDEEIQALCRRFKIKL